jgi:hypothetical protein
MTSEKLFAKVAATEQRLASLDVSIHEAESAIASADPGPATSSLVDKLTKFRAEARALAAALPAMDRAAVDAYNLETQEGRQQAQSWAEKQTQPIKNKLATAFAEIREAIQRNGAATPDALEALQAAQASAFAAVDLSVEPEFRKRDNAAYRPQKALPFRDARGRRCTINNVGQICDPISLEPVQVQGY